MLFARTKLHLLKKNAFIAMLLAASTAGFSFSGCSSESEANLSSPPEYKLNEPAVVKLPSYLDEISGIAYYAKDKSVFAISDEQGVLYKIFLSGKMNIQRWKFDKKSDFEDVVLVDSTFYILKSTGELITLNFFSPDSIIINNYKFPVPGKNEFEILYHDKASNRLVLICKDCDADDSNSLTAWAFDLPSNKFLQAPAYVMDVRKVEALMEEKKVKFKPSAASINPLTGKLFIVSAINKVVVIADRSGNPEKVYRVNSKMFKQPEGMTFSPEGHLLISNESKDIGAANIFIFKYTKGQ